MYFASIYNGCNDKILFISECVLAESGSENCSNFDEQQDFRTTKCYCF